MIWSLGTLQCIYRRLPYRTGQVLQTCCRNLRHHCWLQLPPAVQEQSWKDTPSLLLHTPTEERNLKKRYVDAINISMEGFWNWRKHTILLTWYVQISKAISCSASNDVASSSSTLHISDATACPCGGTTEWSNSWRTGRMWWEIIF